MQKERRDTLAGAPTPCTHHISETISSPFRGAFHLSLTVLSAIDLCTCFSLGWWSTRIQAGFHVSDPTQDSSSAFIYFAYGAITLYGRPFQERSSIDEVSHIEVLQPPPLATLGETPNSKS